jgi:putative transposase
MSRYIRSTTPGASYFFTVTLQDRSADTLVRHVDALRECIRAVKTRHPFDIDAMVVLPEHLHAVWTMPREDADFPTRWMLVKQGFSKRLGRPVWQRRYWEHQIRDEDDLRRHIDYIHFNPVKHGRVQRAGDWPHSSFHRYVREGRLPADWGLARDFVGSYGE